MRAFLIYGFARRKCSTAALSAALWLPFLIFTKSHGRQTARRRKQKDLQSCWFKLFFFTQIFYDPRAPSQTREILRKQIKNLNSWRFVDARRLESMIGQLEKLVSWLVTMSGRVSSVSTTGQFYKSHVSRHVTAMYGRIWSIIRSPVSYKNSYNPYMHTVVLFQSWIPPPPTVYIPISKAFEASLFLHAPLVQHLKPAIVDLIEERSSLAWLLAKYHIQAVSVLTFKCHIALHPVVVPIPGRSNFR